MLSNLVFSSTTDRIIIVCDVRGGAHTRSSIRYGTAVLVSGETLFSLNVISNCFWLRAFRVFRDFLAAPSKLARAYNAQFRWLINFFREWTIPSRDSKNRGGERFSRRFSRILRLCSSLADVWKPPVAPPPTTKQIPPLRQPREPVTRELCTVRKFKKNFAVFCTLKIYANRFDKSARVCSIFFAPRQVRNSIVIRRVYVVRNRNMRQMAFRELRTISCPCLEHFPRVYLQRVASTSFKTTRKISKNIARETLKQRIKTFKSVSRWYRSPKMLIITVRGFFFFRYRDVWRGLITSCFLITSG